MDDYPAVIWIPTYGTDSPFDDWFADPDMASEDDVKYIRADIVGVKDDNFRDLAYQHGAALRDVAHYKAEIRRMEDTIAQMSGELTDAYQARDEADKACAALEIEKNRWGEMYWELKNSPKLWNPLDLPERTFLRSYPCAYQYRDEEDDGEYEIFDTIDDLLAALDEEE
jgi:hypothetical protein